MTDPAAPSLADLTALFASLNVALGQLVQFTSHVSTGAMTAHAIEWAKRGRLAVWWGKLSDRAKVVWTAIAAALPASGIVVTFAHPKAGSYLLSLDNLTWMSAGVLVWSVCQNWVWQQGYYQSVIKSKPVVGPPASAPAAEPVHVTTT